MNRRQKIIISVTGIFLVALILMGLTYAYFLTQITGNTNPTSISVETADLRVVYGDGTQELLTSSTKLVPSSNAINTKDFTVTNTGDKTEYAVIIENVRVKVAGTENLTTFESNDFILVIKSSVFFFNISLFSLPVFEVNNIPTPTPIPAPNKNFPNPFLLIVIISFLSKK